MPPYFNISVINKLDDEVNDVKVCFAESVKEYSVSCAYDYRAVNVETEQNVYWKKMVHVGNISSQKKRESSERVYFGNNRGYWQVYFTYKGKNHKLNLNNAEFNVSGKDNGKVVSLEIMHHRSYIYVNFKSPSSTTYYYAEEKNPIERGIFVAVRNKLPKTIRDVCVHYAESKSSVVNTETGENVVWKETVSLEKNEVPEKHETRSRERIKFSNQKCFLQVYFSYNGLCYKLNTNSARFDINYCDNGCVLIITIDWLNKNSPVNVSFDLNGRKKSFNAETVM